jgi:tocopherol O-methyltransferase
VAFGAALAVCEAGPVASCFGLHADNLSGPRNQRSHPFCAIRPAVAGPRLVMIIPKAPQTTAAVAAHYNELDRFYREIWGHHVHHGYWATGRETPRAAAEALVDLIADRLELRPGLSLIDIGCGYGATAWRLAETRGVTVTGVTVSAAQANYAAAVTSIDCEMPVSIRLGDWLANDFGDASFDRAYAIESSEHMPDQLLFFSEAFRVLRPGGVFVICAWLACTRPRRWAVNHLLEPICREGRLPSMGSADDYCDLAREAGFHIEAMTDLSRKVRRTWWICLTRVIGKIVRDPSYRRFLAERSSANCVFALTIVRILVAYHTGSMRYCMLQLRKPD